jgi:chaperone modulatory protein CbpM
MNSEQETRVGVLLDESVEFSLSEICSTCHVHAELIVQLVEVGVLEPRGTEPGQWRFPGHALRRIERALNLQRDLEINLAGVALALDLLDEIDQLRSRLRMFESET